MGSFKRLIVPLNVVGNMEQATVKVDAKGRICIPAEIRGEIGDAVIFKKTPQGYLLVPGKQRDAHERLVQIINSKHRRTGKPENWSPEKMKSIWNKIK
jgi:AbrB family looped-hinge helix DNA binding protein